MAGAKALRDGSGARLMEAWHRGSGLAEGTGRRGGEENGGAGPGGAW
jgi:hypothetical protein